MALESQLILLTAKSMIRITIAVLSLMRYTRFVQDVGAQHRIAPTTVPHSRGKRYKR